MTESALERARLVAAVVTTTILLAGWVALSVVPWMRALETAVIVP